MQSQISVSPQNLPDASPSPTSIGFVPAAPFRRKVARTGTILFLTGLLLVAVGELLSAVQSYVFLTNPFSSVQQYELYGALSATIILFGVLFAGVGWVWDQDAVARATSAPGTFVRGGMWVTGVVVVLLGVICAAIWSGFYAYLSYAAYYQVSLTLWRYTYTTFEFVLAFAFVFLAIGWVLQHWARLNQIERGSA